MKRKKSLDEKRTRVEINSRDTKFVEYYFDGIKVEKKRFTDK